MSVTVFFITVGVIFGTILLIFGMKYLSAAYQARSRSEGETAYRDLARAATTAQSQTASSLSSIQSELVTVVTRLTSLETILKAVE